MAAPDWLRPQSSRSSLQPNVSVTALPALKPERPNHHNIPVRNRFWLSLVCPDVELVHTDTCRRHFLEGGDVYLIRLSSRLADHIREFAATSTGKTWGL
jgi:hypothetical protein